MCAGVRRGEHGSSVVSLGQVAPRIAVATAAHYTVAQMGYLIALLGGVSCWPDWPLQ